MRISDWSSDVCSSDLRADPGATHPGAALCPDGGAAGRLHRPCGGTQGNRQSLREGTLRRGSSDMSGDLVEAAISALATAYEPYSNFSVGDGSEERRVGKAGVSTCKSRLSPYH